MIMNWVNVWGLIRVNDNDNEKVDERKECVCDEDKMLRGTECE